MRALASLAPLASLALGGCLTVPHGAVPVCASNDDCNRSAGEVCDEGLCWGDPPAGSFAATLSAPSDHSGVVATEIPLLSIPDFGWIDGLALEAPVTISGRVDPYCVGATGSCDGSSLGATITVTRPSSFHGGPGFRVVATSKSGVVARGDSFSVLVPRTRDGDPPYTITVMPDGRGDAPPSNGSQSPAEIAPPLRMTLAASDNHPNTQITLGSDASVTISGQLTDGETTPHLLTKYRVVALGRWDATSALTEVSTIAYTTTGQFTLTLSDNVYGPVEIVAKPYESNVVAPTLRLPNVTPGASWTLAQPPTLGDRVPVTISVEGLAAEGGGVKPVSGARVIVTSSYDPVLSNGTRADLSVEATTGEDGTAALQLFDGEALAGSYKLRVIPPPGSSLGVIYDQPLDLGDIKPARLPSRVALRGVVADASGAPVSNVAVTVRPSLRFAWSLLPADQQFLAAIPAATTVTPDSGEFVVWVDPLIASVWGYYDLDFEPPLGSYVPNWTMEDVAIPRIQNQTTVSLDKVDLPPAALVHGRITDAAGTPLEGAELRIYAIDTDPSLCTQVAHAPADCVIPAQVVGHGTSDDQGLVRLPLPRP